MDILYHVLFSIWIFCIEVCFIAVTVGIVWMVYMIVKTDKKDKELSPEDFVDRIAYHMGLPEDEYNRLMYTKFGYVSRIDFDGGSPELHQNACCVELTEDVARRIGHTFSTRHKRAWEAKDGHLSN